MEADPFDGLLDLEDTFYDEGYQLGVADGSRAGHIEGRLFGLEKGFGKYAAMGRLHGRSAVWAGRLPRAASERREGKRIDGSTSRHHDQDSRQLRPDLSEGGLERTENEEPEVRLLPLSENVRLAKHVQTLYALVEPASLSTQNSEESVSDFDDRLKRATAKIKVIEKIIGEVGVDDDGVESGGSPKTDGRGNNAKRAMKSDEQGNIEDISALKARH